MANAPQLKIYSADGEYVGSAKYPHIALGAALHCGDGSTVRLGHSSAKTLITISDSHWDSYDESTEEIIRALEWVTS